MRFWIAAVGAIILVIGAWLALAGPALEAQRPVSAPRSEPEIPLEEVIRQAKQFELPAPPGPGASEEDLRAYQRKLMEIIAGTDPRSTELIKSLQEARKAARQEMAKKHRERAEAHAAKRKREQEEERARVQAEHPKDPNQKKAPPELRAIQDIQYPPAPTVSPSRPSTKGN